MEALSASAFFGGSNALWRTAVLRGFTFSTGVQTEDIDVSARAMLNNHNIVCHAGLEPQTSRGPQAGLLLTRVSLASDRPFVPSRARAS